jgi:hypothetical protein
MRTGVWDWEGASGKSRRRFGIKPIGWRRIRAIPQLKENPARVDEFIEATCQQS